jgi:UDP-N-acetylmuramate--alanine ligase
MEYLHTTQNGAQIFSDYGHIASSLMIGRKSLQEKFPEKKLTGIFQPHQMHRILQGWTDFPSVLKHYDQCYIYDIYAARENISDFAQEEIFREYGLQSVEDL